MARFTIHYWEIENGTVRGMRILDWLLRPTWLTLDFVVVSKLQCHPSYIGCLVCKNIGAAFVIQRLFFFTLGINNNQEPLACFVCLNYCILTLMICTLLCLSFYAVSYYSFQWVPIGNYRQFFNSWKRVFLVWIPIHILGEIRALQQIQNSGLVSLNCRDLLFF